MTVTDKVLIFYTHFNTPLPTDSWQFYISPLPHYLQQKINRFRRWQDQHASLLGKLLLQQALSQVGYPSDSLYRLQYNEYNRPFLDKHVDFNISHAGEYVICAIILDGRLGIDIEAIRIIDLADFYHYMTPQQWQAITNSWDTFEVFYNYWTIKESVIKAEGRGLSIPLQDIHIEAGQARLYDHNWFIKPLKIDSRYACHLAINRAKVIDQVIQIQFEESTPQFYFKQIGRGGEI